MASIKNLISAAICLPLRAQGFSQYMAWDWIKRCADDLRTPSDLPITKKLWAQSKGFLSFRIDQYGIDRSNYKSFVSDRDYMWLHPVNSDHRRLLDNKLSFRPVLNRFRQHLPSYYMLVRPGGVFYRLCDLPDNMQAGLDAFILLLKTCGTLALKPVRGTHGDGFLRIEHRSGKYYVNLRSHSEQELCELIGTLKSDYIISEYIVQHMKLSRIYPNAVCTIRAITVNKNGCGAELCEAYLRIGSSATGVVDNLGAGGMMAELDAATGHYSNARAVSNGRIVPCPRHPDTGTLIEGDIPGWESMMSVIVDIASYFPQLEFLGFDCAVTQDGFKLIEINTFPDYPRIQRISSSLREYLFGKIAHKKAHRSEFVTASSDAGGNYSALFSDRVSTRFMLDMLPDNCLCKSFYHVTRRDGAVLSLAMPDKHCGERLCARPVMRLQEDMLPIDGMSTQDIFDTYGEVLICEELCGETLSVFCEKGTFSPCEALEDKAVALCCEKIASAFAHVERLELRFIKSNNDTRLIDCFVPENEE